MRKDGFIYMNAFLFAGQGSQYVGMGKELLETNPEFLSVFELASDITGTNLQKLIFNGSEEDLSRTVNSQPAIMAVSLLCFKCAVKHGITFDAVAGHSLGEYAAMVASGMLSMEDGFRVIKARAEAMDKAAGKTEGSMAAILKLPPQKVEEICRSVEGYVVPVNYNSPMQTVIAGEKSAVDKAADALSKEGARVMPLKVSSAFHSKLMSDASEEFLKQIINVSFKPPTVSFYSNVTGKKLDDFTNIPTMLAKHIISPVKFTDELNSIKNDGISGFVELGPNKVLTGLVKKTLKDVIALNIENTQTLEAALSALKG